MKFYQHLLKHKYFISSLLLFYIISGFGQNTEYQLRLAQRLENSKEYEEALKIYRRIDDDFHQNLKAVKGITNCLKNLMQYEEMVIYLEDVISKIKGQNKFYMDLGEAYILTDRKEKAIQLWNQLIDLQKTNVSMYRLVASSMIRQRLYDEAIEIYQKALKNINGQYYLYLDIANLYKSRLDMKNAVQNYLNYYEKYPKQKLYFQNQILNLTKDDNHVETVSEVLKDYIKNNHESESIKEVLGGVYIKSRQYDQAFEIYQSLQNEKSKGNYLFKFGKEAQKNKAYVYAIKAFNLILKNYQDDSHYNETQFELARTHYYFVKYGNLRFNTDEESEHIEKAIQIFKSLIQKNNIRSFSDFSSLYLGDLFLKYYFDVDNAIHYYNLIVTHFKNSSVYNKSIIQLGDCYVIKGDLSKAKETYVRLKGKDKNSIANYKLAEIDYFQGDFSAAKIKYNRIVEHFGIRDSLTNNSLNRIMLIDSFSSDSLMLKKYTHGELLIFQKKYSEAIELFYELVNSGGTISATAGKAAAQLLIKLKRYSEASILLGRIIEDSPNDYQIDEFIFLLAVSEEKLENLKKAFELYQKILTEFETSLYYENSRIKARELSKRIKKESVSG